MKISLNTIFNFNIKLSTYLFFFIFWGYILYTFLLYFSLIPPFLGGYFGILSLITALLFLPSFYLTNKYCNHASKKINFLIQSSLFICIFYTSIFFFLDNNPLAIQQSVELIIFWLALFPLGFYLVFCEKTKIVYTSIFLGILFLGFVIFYFTTTNKYMLPFGTSLVEDENISGYQGLARNILIIAFLAFSFSKSFKLKIFSVLMFSTILFAIGSRSEFFAYLLALILYLILSSYKLKYNLLTTIILISTLCFSTYWFYDFISNSRVFNITNIDQDNSWNGRNQLKEFAIQTLQKHFILGDFGSHITNTGNANKGTYAHNILSGYVNYGIFFFIFTTLTCYITTIFSAYKIIINPNNNSWLFAFLLSFTVCFLVTVSKPIFWPIIYLSWGVFLGTLYIHKTR